MISVYAQYSFGGYKIYRLTPDTIEEVSDTNRLGIPDSGIQLFSHYGVKLMCGKDLNGNYLLFVNDIPCREQDDMGRAKTCSYLITGSSQSDMRLLRRLAVMIAFELSQFEEYFSGLFSITDTLNFDYKSFREFMGSAHDEVTIADDPLRKALALKSNPIIVYTCIDPKSAIKPLFNRFDKSYLRYSYFLKWDENSRSINDNAIERIGFLHLIQQIINKITTIWKN